MIVRWAVFFLVFCFAAPVSAQTTLIAPMVEGLKGCKSASENLAINDANSAKLYCESKSETAASLLEETLSALGPVVSADGKFEIGYTLNLPLLSYLELQANEWVPNYSKIKRDLQLLIESQRSAVVYLFANHFGSGEAKDIIEQLVMDDASIMRLADGSKLGDKYFSTSVTAWSINNKESMIRKAKKVGFMAVVDELCKLSKQDQDKIHAVTLLGETHYIFPNFKTGMGYSDSYQITDYSSQSVKGFQEWLLTRFGKIEHLNARLQSEFEGFEHIFPPTKNIKKDKLNHFFEHIDPYAHGVVPFFGWAYDREGHPFDIMVYLNGQYIGDADKGLTRLDVAQAIPELDDSNVGYRYDLDFSSLPPGLHTVELRFLQDGKSSLLRTYHLSVMDRKQSQPIFVKQYVLGSPTESSLSGIRHWSDHPENLIALFFNPLAKLWNEYREVQVQAELEYFSSLLNGSCIERDKVFSAQIASMYNASWNPAFFAADRSILKNESYELGINLYGGVVYGDFLFDWLKDNHHVRYGIPEMHPMTEQTPESLVEAFHRHHAAGAYFLSPYFFSVKPDRFEVDSEHEKYRLSPSSPHWGSANYYQALKQLMTSTVVAH